jgi:hypothetical protein
MSKEMSSLSKFIYTVYSLPDHLEVCLLLGIYLVITCKNNKQMSTLSACIFICALINPLLWLHLIVSSIYLVITSQDNKLYNLKKYLEAELTFTKRDDDVEKIVEKYKRTVFSLPLWICKLTMLPVLCLILGIEYVICSYDNKKLLH